MDNTKIQPTLLGDILKKFEGRSNGKYIAHEFQDYGYRLAVDLDDLPHKALYIRMAKTVDRVILEQARAFVVDASHAKSKGRLFMWKVSELKRVKNLTSSQSRKTE
ncbi:MAG: hypothetical protein ABII21_00840 [bacterium]